MEIKVTGCHDCPFAECDYDGTLEYYCEHFNTPIYNVNSYYETESVHPSCPLKQESITVKLEEAKKPLYDGCATCKNNVDGIDAGIWCITHCINGSKYEKL